MAKVTASQRKFIEPLRFGRPETNWSLPELPQLRPNEPISLDFEYRPDDDPTKSDPFSFAVYSPERKEGWYIPWKHEGGGNFDEAVAKQWFKDNIKDRDIYGLNMKAEAHSAFNWGIDPNDQGWRPHDVAFAATLLNENRYKGFSLESLAEEYLPADERKVHLDVPPEHFFMAHAGEVAPRCVSDAYLAWRVHEVTRPQIEAEKLERVNEVEDGCILPVVHMERAGALIDRPKLEHWLSDIQLKIQEKCDYVYQATGVVLISDGPKVLEKLFASRGLDKPIIFNEATKQEEESWAADAMKSVDDPIIKAAYDVRRWRSIKSKYLTKYLCAIDSTNTLRFPLHQLRSTNEFGDSGEKGNGTVTGRFACGGNYWKINIQQVMKVEKQIETFGCDDFIIRELFIPEAGKLMGASDASQIEFRIFSHYAALIGYPGTAEAYAKNPMEDFHMLVTIMMNPGVSAKDKLKALRKHMKHNNFGVLYGMGRQKLARRLGLACVCQHYSWWDYWKLPEGTSWADKRRHHFEVNDNHASDCPGRRANDIMDEYDDRFPEANKLKRMASDRAKDVGYVQDLLGRRRRYPGGQRLNSALNSVIQPGAASYFKLKLIELHRERKTLQTNLRMPVHDEFVYDIDPDPTYQHRTQELLDTQSVNLKVPLLWESDYGNNWREANGQ